MRTLLIDADIFVHQVATVCEIPIQWDEDLWTLHSSMSDAQSEVERRLDQLRSMLEPDKIILALSSRTNWRKGMMPEYKAHRKKTRKPLVWKPLRDYLADKYDVREIDNLEGDDVLSLLITAPNPKKNDRIIVSIDKDFRSVPGRVFNWKLAWDAFEAESIDTPDEAIETVTTEAADRFHLLQTLAGDATDGYAGCPGVGMTTAEKLLDAGSVLRPTQKVLRSGPRKGETVEEWVASEPGTPWQIVESVFASKGLSSQVALLNARVARLLRHGEYNHSTGEVKLWNPPSSSA